MFNVNSLSLCAPPDGSKIISSIIFKSKRSSEESRDDDKIDVITTRYNEYLHTTEKVSQFYKEIQPKIFHEVDGINKIDELTSKIKEILKKS